MAFLLSDLKKSKYGKMVGTISALMAVFLIMVWARAFYGSMQAYKKGEVHLKAHRYIKAVTFYDRSIHWYTPLSPYVQKSAERLWEIGLHAERKGDVRLALIAFRTIRRGFYAASNVITPGQMWIEKCETKIAELVKLEKVNRERDEGLELQKRLIINSQKAGSPDVFWSIILEIGFFGWVGSVICFIILVLRRKAELVTSIRLSLLWIGLVLIFFSLWFLGMIKA